MMHAFVLNLVFVCAANAQGWKPPSPESLRAPRNDDARVVVCTGDELGRLRNAYEAGQPLLLNRVRAAHAALAAAVVFPPRGGQHNQWYQCEKCQLGLTTVSSTRHKCRQCGKVYTGAPYDDVIFSRVMDYDWREMNKTGSSLVWGHPQGPTLTRILIEALEEAVSLGGGNVLVFGSRAGGNPSADVPRAPGGAA